MPLAIKVEGLSKIYQIGQIGTGTITRDIERWAARIRGKEDPFMKVGEVNERSTAGGSDWVWSLKDINFEIEQGDTIGIIGRNGAGKSTLLKILSRVTSPTTGTVSARGRIASLLEVGTGFHPELSGRDNIFLNGAILGMRKHEIVRKLDEIVAFSGVERYIDTPVKRYSSGMYVRLAFAVAAHLDAEILIVDEVLAVGDAEFQKKCLGKMEEASKIGGKTVLFVSHNMTSISTLCSKGILLTRGTIDAYSDVNKILNLYYSKIIKKNYALYKNGPLINDEILDVHSFDIKNNDEEDCLVFKTTEDINIRVLACIKLSQEGLRIGFDLINSKHETVFRSFHDDIALKVFSEGKHLLYAKIPKNLLQEDSYTISLQIGIHNVRWISNENLFINFDVKNIDGVNLSYKDQRPGIISPKIDWGFTC